MSAATPTKGPVEVASGGVRGQLTEYFVRRVGDDVSIAADVIDPDTSAPSEVNAKLIADAFNAYTKTGLTPSQLVTSREELVGRGYGDDAYISTLESAVKTLRAALETLYTFPGVTDRLAAKGSLGSIRDQVDAALEATKAVAE